MPSRRTLVVTLLLALPLAGFGTWVLYGSQWLRVERVSVHWSSGPQKLAPHQIRSVARIRVGSPLASLDKGAVRNRLLAELPRLASVEVVRGWPDGVTVKVTERRALVLLTTRDGYAEVDADGVVFAAGVPRRRGVPLLELPLEPGPSLRRFGEDRIRQAAVAATASLPEAVRRDTRTVRATSYDAISLELTGNRTVRWGSADDSAAKAEVLALLMEASPGAAHFDVSVPSAPAVAPG